MAKEKNGDKGNRKPETGNLKKIDLSFKNRVRFSDFFLILWEIF
jgi:hypothetical protein